MFIMLLHHEVCKCIITTAKKNCYNALLQRLGGTIFFQAHSILLDQYHEKCPVVFIKISKQK